MDTSKKKPQKAAKITVAPVSVATLRAAVSALSGLVETHGHNAPEHYEAGRVVLAKLRKIKGVQHGNA